MKLTEGFNLLATAPDGIKHLRELILSLAVQGKLVPQDPNDEPASELLKQIRAEKDRLIAEGKIKKDKPLPEISDDEKPFELPVGWEWVRLGDVFDIVYGKGLSNSELTESGYDVFGANGIIGKYKSFLYESPQLLISCRGAYSGKPNVSPPFCFVTSNSLVMQNSWVHLNLKFIYFALTNADKSQIVTGSAQPQVTTTNLAPFITVLPPYAEQCRIAAKVEELMALCDALETRGQLAAEQHARLTTTLCDALAASESAHQLQENWARLAASFDLVLDRPQAVDALEQTLLQLAVRGLLVPQDPTDEPASELLKQIRAEKDRLIAEGKIKKDKPLPAISDDEKPFDLPQGWEWVRLGDISSRVQYGFTASADHTVDMPKMLRITDIQDDRVDWSNVPGVNADGKDLSPYFLEAGDLLIARTGGTIGKTFLVNEAPCDSVFASYLIRISPLRGVFSAYLKIFASSDLYWRQLLAKSMGTGQPNVNGTSLAGLVMPLPPLAEQSRIVARVEALRTLCGQLRERLAASRQTQAHLAEALVAQT